MATAEEGGATATTSSYGGGGGGAGGKFTKKSFRKAATPYDRPLLAPRRNDNNGSWLSKMVVEPASKLINYGAHRLFASLFRKRLPPPTSEINNGPSGGLPEAVPHTQQGAQEPSRGECSQPIDSSKSSGISELEQLLKQKTFTRSEIGHLTELLQSRAGEVPFSDGGKRNDETANEFGRHQQFASNLIEGNRSGGDRSHGMMSTPMSNSQVLEESIASPAELAKAFMGSRPSKVSPSMLGMRSPVSREDTFLSSTRFASKSPIMSLRTKTSAGRGAPDNGFITPRSRGRSAIYNMSRPLNSTVRPTSTLKGNGINGNGYAGLAMSPASLSSVEPDERFGPKSMTLKRRSSVLDDDVGSVSSIRRIRQKSNAIAPRIPHTSDSKQKQPLISEQKHVGKTVVENADQGFPSTSYDPVTSSSSEVASRILQHLEKLTPKQKSSEYKFVDVREKSTFKLTQNMLGGQALRSMEDLSSSKLLLDLQDDNKPASSSKATLPVASGSTSQQGKIEENSPQKSYTPMNNDSAVTVKASGFNAGTSKSVVETGLSEPPQKKRAFRMSAVEDYFDFDDDIECNGLASQPSVEGSGPVGPHTTDNISPAEKPKYVRTTISPEVKLPSGHVSSETTDRSPGTFMVGEGSSSVPLSNSEAATTAVQSAVFPVSSVAAFDKPKETNSPPPLFSFSSKAADKFLFSSESSSRTPEAKPESPNSMVNVPVPSGAPMKSPDIEKGSQLNPPKTDDRNAETVPSAASNGPLHSSPLAGSFTTASFKETNEKSTAAAPLLFTPSTSIDNFVPGGTGTSTSTASSSSIFGLAAPSSNVTGSVFKFGASTEPSSAVSAATTTIVPLGGDSKTNADTDPSTGSSSSALSNVVPFSSASSVHGMFGLSSSVSHSTANNNLQGSLFGNASKPFVSGLETASQGTSVQSVAPASSPSFSMNTAPVSFGFSSSSASSTVTTSAVIPSNAVSSSSNAAPSTFSFGFSSSSSSTNAVGSSTGGGVFSFGAGSSVSAPVVNTASTFSSGTTTSGVFNFGGNSSSSSAINSASSSSAPSTNAFGSTWQNPKPSVFGSAITSAPASTGFAFGSTTTSAPPSTGFAFGSTTTSAPPSTGFAFGSSSTTSAPTNAAPGFSFNTPSPSVFGNAPSGFGASPVSNNDQMSAEDSMAEDTVQSTAPSVPAFGQMFGQAPVSPSPTGFMFGSTPPSQSGNNNPFPFGGQQQNNQVAPQNPSPFQASNSLEFNAGGSFSLGSGAGDKAGRKFVKIGRSKNRKK